MKLLLENDSKKDIAYGYLPVCLGNQKARCKSYWGIKQSKESDQIHAF